MTVVLDDYELDRGGAQDASSQKPEVILTPGTENGSLSTSLESLPTIPNTVDELLVKSRAPNSRQKSGPLPNRQVPLTLRITVSNPDGSFLGEIPILLTKRIRRGRAIRLSGRDSSRSLEVALEVDVAKRVLNISFSWDGTVRALPSALLPTARLVRLLKAGNLLSAHIQDSPLVEKTPLPHSLEELVPEKVFQLAGRLAALQEETDFYFYLPAEFSQRDFRNLRRAERLLQGERVTETWNRITINLVPQDRDVLPPVSAAEFSFIFENHERTEIAGNLVPLGMTSTHLLSARVASRTETSDGSVELVLEPGSLGEFEIWKMSESQTRDEVVPGISSRFRETLARVMKDHHEVLQRLA